MLFFSKGLAIACALAEQPKNKKNTIIPGRSLQVVSASPSIHAVIDQAPALGDIWASGRTTPSNSENFGPHLQSLWNAWGRGRKTKSKPTLFNPGGGARQHLQNTAQPRCKPKASKSGKPSTNHKGSFQQLLAWPSKCSTANSEFGTLPRLPNAWSTIR